MVAAGYFSAPAGFDNDRLVRFDDQGRSVAEKAGLQVIGPAIGDAPVQRRIVPGTVGIEPGCLIRRKFMLLGRPFDFDSRRRAADGFHFDGFGNQRLAVVDEPEPALVRIFEGGPDVIDRSEGHRDRGVGSLVTDMDARNERHFGTVNMLFFKFFLCGGAKVTDHGGEFFRQ